MQQIKKMVGLFLNKNISSRTFELVFAVNVNYLF